MASKLAATLKRMKIRFVQRFFSDVLCVITLLGALELFHLHLPYLLSNKSPTTCVGYTYFETADSSSVILRLIHTIFPCAAHRRRRSDADETGYERDDDVPRCV